MLGSQTAAFVGSYAQEAKSESHINKQSIPFRSGHVQSTLRYE